MGYFGDLQQISLFLFQIISSQAEKGGWTSKLDKNSPPPSPQHNRSRPHSQNSNCGSGGERGRGPLRSHSPPPQSPPPSIHEKMGIPRPHSPLDNASPPHGGVSPPPRSSPPPSFGIQVMNKLFVLCPYLNKDNFILSNTTTSSIS